MIPRLVQQRMRFRELPYLPIKVFPLEVDDINSVEFFLYAHELTRVYSDPARKIKFHQTPASIISLRRCLLLLNVDLLLFTDDTMNSNLVS